MDEAYFHTLSGPGESVLRVRASKFLGYAFPIRDEGSFKVRQAEISALHHTCRHVCFAWVLGDLGEVSRNSDAGEPSGTAGKPILRQIQGQGLSGCGVIVVRYFGGTLLGKGGLVRAYGDTAKLALDNAPTESRILCTRLQVRCGYPLVERLRNEVLAGGGAVVSSDFSSDCSLVLDVPNGMTKAFTESCELLGALVELPDDHRK